MVQAVRGDFLKLRHGGARAILVDPSCSGGFEGEAASSRSRNELDVTRRGDRRVPEQSLTSARARRAEFQSAPSACPTRRVSYAARRGGRGRRGGGALADADIRKGAGASRRRCRRGRGAAGPTRAWIGRRATASRADPSKDATGAFFVALFERSAGAARKRRRRGQRRPVFVTHRSGPRRRRSMRSEKKKLVCYYTASFLSASRKKEDSGALGEA